MSEISKLKVSKTMVIETAKTLMAKCLETEVKNDNVEVKELLSELARLNSVIDFIDEKMILLVAQPTQMPQQEVFTAPLELNCFL